MFVNLYKTLDAQASPHIVTTYAMLSRNSITQRLIITPRNFALYVVLALWNSYNVLMLLIVLKRATQQKGAQVEDYVITYVVFLSAKAGSLRRAVTKVENSQYADV